MAIREPRWSPDETCETGWSVGNLLEKHAGQLDGALADLGGPQGARTTLIDKANGIRDLSVQIQSGEVEPEAPAALVEAIEEVPLIVRAVRESVKRRHRGDAAIGSAFGVGTVLDTTSHKSLLRAISLVNEGVELYPEIGERLPADLRQRAATHEETLLQARVESLPQRNQPNPDIAARNGLQVEVQDLVDQVLAGVATHCWRNPEILAEFKAALPATRPPKK